MNQLSTNDHKERINRVLTYIQKHLDEHLDLDTLSKVACFSSFHFHRIFSAYMGESVSNYVRRIRLENAAGLLRYTDIPIGDIGFKAGYETHSAFSKAFKQLFGTSPINFRKEKPHYHLQLDKPEPLTTQNGDIVMDYEIRERDEKLAVYCRQLGKYQDAATKAWKNVCDFAFPKQLVKNETEFIGISYDNPDITAEEKLRYDACITVDKAVECSGDIGTITIAGGKYAVFLHEGPYETLNETYRHIHGTWLKDNVYQLRDVPCFEKYLNSVEDTPSEDLKTEIFLPIL